MNAKLPRVEDVIMAEGILLADRGAYYQGLCPFHPDKAPSLVVYKSNNHFYCFGCMVAGDSIAFIQKYKKLSFHDALDYLNIKDFKWVKPLPDIFDMIVQEENEGIDIVDKYGKEFLEILKMKYIKKIMNKSIELQNKVKVDNISTKIV